MILNDEKIKKLIIENELIKRYIDLENQLTPNGFDLTVDQIFSFDGKGQIGFTNEDRILPQIKEVLWENDSAYLSKGCYKIRSNEILRIPLDLVAIAMPRSSLLRSGVSVSTGVWDAGFEGKSEFLLNICNEDGFCLKKNARIIQLIFMTTNAVKKGYDGIFNYQQK